MKKKIAILGSTGSIGKSLIDIILKDRKNFEVKLLTANKNYRVLYNQAKLLNVKNIIITDKRSFALFKKKKISKKFKIFNNFKNLKKILPNKVDYSMSSISGINGLEPTLQIIKRSKAIAIANKESIICGWNLIKDELKQNKTNFIPVDSEHFSIWSLLRSNEISILKKIYITASGGPFINYKYKQFKNIKPKDALKHPNWSMGKKISIDSATMMNKVFEVIETNRIFDVSYDKISILSHEKSYLHAIIEFNNGLIKFLAHETDMKIPIFNSLYEFKKNIVLNKNLDINKMNNLNLKKIDYKQFPVVKILKNYPKNNTLYDTVIISINDTLVNLFLQKKISFTDISKNFLKFSKLSKFQKYKKIRPKNVNDIYKLSKYVSLKTRSICI